MSSRRDVFAPPVALDRTSEVSLHRQIHNRIAMGIRHGEINSDVRLPSTRLMARLLRVFPEEGEVDSGGEITKVADGLERVTVADIDAPSTGLAAWGVDASRIHTERFGPKEALPPGIEPSSGPPAHLPAVAPGSGSVDYRLVPMEPPAQGNLLTRCSQPSGDIEIDL